MRLRPLSYELAPDSMVEEMQEQLSGIVIGALSSFTD